MASKQTGSVLHVCESERCVANQVLDGMQIVPFLKGMYVAMVI